MVHGLNVGADNYVTKPYDSALLLERVRGALGKPSTVSQQEKFTTCAEIDGEEIVVRAGLSRRSICCCQRTPMRWLRTGSCKPHR